MKKAVLILQYSTLKSIVVQYNNWPTGGGIEWTGKKSSRLEEGDEVGDGRTARLSAIGNGGHAAVSLTPDLDGTPIHIFEISQLEELYVGDLV